MPIYAYRCSACGHSKDVLQKMSDPVLSTCPSCGQDTFSKQVTAAGFQLKGSGWYVTDFRGGSNASGAAASGAAASATAAAGATTASGDSAGASSNGSASGGSDSCSTGGATSASAGGCGTACACH